MVSCILIARCDGRCGGEDVEIKATINPSWADAGAAAWQGVRSTRWQLTDRASSTALKATNSFRQEASLRPSVLLMRSALVSPDSLTPQAGPRSLVA